MARWITIFISVLWTVACWANPIVPEANMPSETLSVEIHPADDELTAYFSGQYHFSYIDEYLPYMYFPVPPDANNVSVCVDGEPIGWQIWPGWNYHTNLAEMPEMPIIKCDGPFAKTGAVVTIEYEHRLIQRTKDYIYFYPFTFSGTHRNEPTIATVKIKIPPGFHISEVRLGDTLLEYSSAYSKIMITTEFPPEFVADAELLVSLVPGYFDDCGVLVQGVECLLFKADGGGLYVLDNTGDFNVGDRVRVRGVLNPDCVSICMQGNGCIEHNTISVCLDCDFDVDGDMDFGDFAVLASYWLNSECDSQNNWCQATDLNTDGSVGANELKSLADSWLMREEDESKKLGFGQYYLPYENSVEPNAPGYSLPLDLASISNYTEIDHIFNLEPIAPRLEQNGFAFVEHDFGLFDPNRDDIVKPYQYLIDQAVPLFVTADTLLHLYHVQFDETLKEIEQSEFYNDICDLTAALLDEALAQYDKYNGDLKEAAKRNVAYLAVAQRLLEPTAEVPTFIANMVDGELAKIDAHEGFVPSDIFIYEEDYSQYVPRGHYTQTEELKRYFRALMWYGRMAFLLKGAENWGRDGDALISVYDARIQTVQAVLLAKSIEEVRIKQRYGRDIWQRMYTVTSFYVGLADDLTPYEYLEVIDEMFTSSFDPDELLDEDLFFAVKTELSLLRSPKIFGGTGNAYVLPPVTPESLDDVLDRTKGMRLMGQRFVPDSYMFQNLVFPEVLDYTGSAESEPFTYGFTGARWGRCYPRSLDVMAILGSEQARAILIEEGDTDYVDYWLRFNELKNEVSSFTIDLWTQNLYWGWLHSLRAIIGGFGQGYPNFMRTGIWEKKELNAALASWTQLRHDTILYAKQSYTPVERGLPPVPTPGYVEPVPEFYGRLSALTRMTRAGLSDMNALSPTAENRLVSLENILTRLIEISNKELTNEPLAEEDHEYIMEFAKTLEDAIMGVEVKGLKTTLVADVHTHTFEGNVVEEAVGYVDLIIVACPLPNGSVFLAAGPVLSYYEFKHPMSDRLTDEAWRQLLASQDRPSRPRWLEPLVH